MDDDTRYSLDIAPTPDGRVRFGIIDPTGAAMFVDLMPEEAKEAIEIIEKVVRYVKGH